MSRDEPAAWHRLAWIRRTPTMTVQWLVASTVGFFAFAYGFGAVLAARRGRPLEPIIVGVPAPGTLLLTLVVSAISLAVVVALHEWLHGLVLARYGGEPRYGIGVTHFGLPYAYATVDADDRRHAVDAPDGDGVPARPDRELAENGGDRATEWGYARNEMLAVLLAPFVVISLAGLVALALFPSPLLAFVLAANAAGSVADLWMATVLMGYPSSVRVGSLSDGFGIYGPREPSRRRSLATALLSATATGALATYAAVVVVLGGLVLHSLAFGTGTVVVEAFERTLFRHELHPDRGVALLAADAPAIAGLSAVGGLAWLVLTAPQRLGARDT